MNDSIVWRHISGWAPTVGRFCLGAGFAGLGALNLLHGDFALQWQPAPPDLPGRTLLAYGNGAVSIAAGVLILFRPAALVGASLAALLALLWTLLLHLPRLLTGEPVAWLGVSECLALAVGGWILANRELARRAEVAPWRFLSGRRAIRTGRLLFGASLLAFGASHFAYLQGAAAMVPGWLPAPVFWAQLTGAAHTAAGIALIINALPRTASTLLATMFSLFVLILHAPLVLAEPGSRLEWTKILMALSLTGAAWVIASSFAYASPGKRRAAVAAGSSPLAP